MGFGNLEGDLMASNGVWGPQMGFGDLKEGFGDIEWGWGQ